MLKKLLLSALLLPFTISHSVAQFQCGFDQAHRSLLATEQSYSAKVQYLNDQWAKSIVNVSQIGLVKNSPSGLIYEIPVVIHVIHTGDAVGTIYNPTDAQLNSMMDYLNQSYAATWSNYPSTANGGVNVPIRFTLAKRDPNCQPTNGIVRVNGSGLANYTNGGISANGTPGSATDPAVKALSNWPNDRYYNVYIVNKINGADGTTPGVPFTAGYAYFPGAPANVDGTVMLATQSQPGRITLPHEMGHAMGLYHTFEDGDVSTCPPNNNCNTDGDMVCDTEPHMQSPFNCPVDPNPCTGNSYNFVQYNFMDYSSCQNRFTQGQSNRAVNVLLNNRASLLRSLGAEPLTNAPTTACIPTINNPNNGQNFGPRNVSFCGNTNNSGGYTTEGSNHYIDNTCKFTGTTSLGASEPITITTAGGAHNVRVYIDYNDNGIFDPATELVYSSNGTTNNQTHTGTITIPSTNVVTCKPIRVRIIADQNTNTTMDPCGPLSSGQIEDYSLYVSGNAVTGATSSIALTSGTNPSCLNGLLTFTATNSANISSATTRWYINGVFTGITGNTYTSNNFQNGDIITARAAFYNYCSDDSVTSNAITIQRSNAIAPTMDIAITSGNNPGCIGEPLTFTANVQNGGTNPDVTWYVNNTVVATGLTFTSTTLQNNDVVEATVIGNGDCPDPNPTPATNSITIVAGTFAPTIDFNFVDGKDTICIGDQVTIDAIIQHGGSNPTIAWSVNNVLHSVGNTFSSNSLLDGDVIKATLNSTLSCATPTMVEDSIIMSVKPALSPSVTIAIKSGNNPGCFDELLTFEATTNNVGNNPTIRWYLNNVEVTNGPIYTNNTWNDGDVITAVVTTDPEGCFTRTIVPSNNIVLDLYPPAIAPIISYVGNTLYSTTPAPMQWYGPNGLIPGANNNTYNPGPVYGVYYATYLGLGCPSEPSNKLNLTNELGLGNYDMNQVSITPNPTNGVIKLDWFNKNTTATIDVYNSIGQKVVHHSITDATKTSIDLSSFSAGNYFLQIKDNEGNNGYKIVTLIK